MSVNVAKWRVAHPDIVIHDAALETMAPFPSLFATDFVAYLDSKGEHGKEVITFVRDLGRELVWVYGMLVKAQHDGDPGKFLDAILATASGPGYEFTRKFLRDYAGANNVALPSGEGEGPSWQNIEWQPTAPAGEVTNA